MTDEAGRQRQRETPAKAPDTPDAPDTSDVSRAPAAPHGADSPAKPAKPDPPGGRLPAHTGTRTGPPRGRGPRRSPEDRPVRTIRVPGLFG